MTDDNSPKGKLFVRTEGTRYHTYYRPTSNVFAILLFALLFLLGVVALANGLLMLDTRGQLAAHGVYAQGVVETTSPRGRYESRIRVVYQDAVGKEWRQTYRVRSGWMLGQVVPVIYLPQAPGTSTLAPDASGFSPAVGGTTKWQEEILVGIGALLVLFGGAMSVRVVLGRHQ